MRRFWSQMAQCLSFPFFYSFLSYSSSSVFLWVGWALWRCGFCVNAHSIWEDFALRWPSASVFLFFSSFLPYSCYSVFLWLDSLSLFSLLFIVISLASIRFCMSLNCHQYLFSGHYLLFYFITFGCFSLVFHLYFYTNWEKTDFGFGFILPAQLFFFAHRK